MGRLGVAGAVCRKSGRHPAPRPRAHLRCRGPQPGPAPRRRGPRWRARCAPAPGAARPAARARRPAPAGSRPGRAGAAALPAGAAARPQPGAGPCPGSARTARPPPAAPPAWPAGRAAAGSPPPQTWRLPPAPPRRRQRRRRAPAGAAGRPAARPPPRAPAGQLQSPAQPAYARRDTAICFQGPGSPACGAVARFQGRLVIARCEQAEIEPFWDRAPCKCQSGGAAPPTQLAAPLLHPPISRNPGPHRGYIQQRPSPAGCWRWWLAEPAGWAAEERRPRHSYWEMCCRIRSSAIQHRHRGAW